MSEEIATKPNLITKLAKITAEMDRVQKRGKNTFHGYDFATESDIADVARKVCGEHNIYIQFSSIPETVAYEFWKDGKGKDKVRTMFTGIATIWDGDSSEKLTSYWPAFSHDSDDKGANKASTAFAKYATIRLFHISTGDDPDAHANGEHAEGQKPANVTPQRPAANRQKDEEAERKKLVRGIYKILKIDPASKQVEDHTLALVRVAKALMLNGIPANWTGFQMGDLRRFAAGIIAEQAPAEVEA